MTTLPTITSLDQLFPALKLWQQAINPTLSLPAAPRSPFNFRAVGGAAGATGITLNWEAVSGADGYQIQFSPTGDFSTAAILATLTSPDSTSFFDNTVVTSVKRYYRIRSTSGTINQPQTVFGAWTAPIISTSGNGTTTYDNVSNSSGPGGWNSGNNPGIGNRLVQDLQ